MFSLISLSVAWPIAEPTPDESEGRITSNDLFQQLNELLKREIQKEIKDDSLEVGDKIKADDGKLQISVQHFSSFNNFPVSFKPKDDEVLDDKKVVALVSDFDGSSEYEINKESSEESSEETKPKTTSKKPVELSTTENAESTSMKSGETSTKAPTTTSTEKTKSTTEKSVETSTKASTKTTVKETETSTSQSSVVSSSSTTSPSTSSTTVATQTPSPSSSTSTTDKNHKLLKDIAEEPVIFTHI